MRRKTRAEPITPSAADTIFNAEEVCRSEIEGAIDLLGRFGNYPAAHLLSAAAHSNLRAIAKKEGVALKHDLSALVRAYAPKRESAVMNVFLAPYNGLKHIGSLSSEVFFKLEYVEITLHLAAVDYQQMFAKMTPKMAVYGAWVIHRFPELIGSSKFPAMNIFDGADDPRPEKRLSPLRTALVDVADDPDATRLMMNALAEAQARSSPAR
ncbi:hypothetical protein [Sphingomonas aerolata]|uniref:hypothetical protein n=1 Tax=Sphingomonas aerolata TaxID=185951 RepID=UPI002FDF3251